jgi:hypothetical protein
LVASTTAYLVDRAGLPADAASVASETIVRMLISIVTTPTATNDFDDPTSVEHYAQRVLPPLLTAP